MSYKKWEIYRANLDPVIGSEQGKSRPVIIISETEINQLINIVNVFARYHQETRQKHLS